VPLEQEEEAEPEVPQADIERVRELVAGHWAKADLIRAAELGIWDVPAEGEAFAPNKPVSRAEWVLLLVRALGLEAPSKEAAFPDMEGLDKESGRAIAAALQAGIVNGFEDGSFRPDEEVTRAQMAVMLTRALKLSAGSNSEEGLLFADDKSLPAWARGSVYALSAQGVLKGRDGNVFASADNTTLAEAIVALLRAIDLPAKQA
jgi:hypothetical protein